MIPAPGPAPRRPFGWYDGEGLATRIHVRARWATSPIGPLDPLLPRDGRILDWGCGHGLVSLWLASRWPSRQVEGVDIDAEKLVHARSAAAAAGLGERASFRLLEPGALPAPGWDGIVIDDVLYLLDPPDQEALVRAAAAALEPGGVVLLKEMASTPRWKHALTRAQEVVAVRILRFTRTEGPLHPSPDPEQLATWLRDEGLEVEVLALDHGYHVPHVAVVGRRAPDPVGGGRLPS